MFAEILSESGILELVIEHPPVNAFSIGLLHAVAGRLERIVEEQHVRAVVLRSAGRGFSGGGDVKEAEKLDGFGGILGQASGSLRLSLAVLNCAVPVVCAVHNYCVGVGVLVAASADVLIATRGARFVLAEVDNGATSGGVQALRLMPEKRLRAAMLMAEPVLAEELHAWGSVYRVLDDEAALVLQARTIGESIAAKNHDTVRRLKKSLNNTSKVHELEGLYRAEMSYTYELNIMGVASAGRQAFIDGAREGYSKTDMGDAQR